jgi:hypothetical protein
MAQDSSGMQPQSGYVGGGAAKIVVGIVVVVIIIGILWLLSNHIPSLKINTSSNAPALATVTQTKSANGTTIFMSSQQATAVLGSPLKQYTTLDLFNESFIINASIIESLVPQLNNNITSGWVTFANSSDQNTDASLYYVVMTVNNAPHISTLVGAATISPWFMYAMNLANTNSGSVNGLNYTYAQYTNSTAWAQAVYGWKGNHVVLGLEYSNPGFLVNETALVDAIANDTP